MAKLTDTQLIVLSKAAQRDDGAAVVPKGLGNAPAAKVAASLINRKLMRVVRAKDGMPVWRTDEDGREFSLLILRTGREAIGIENTEAEASPVASGPVSTKRQAASTKQKPDSAKASSASAPFASSVPPRAGSKQAQVIAMLLRKQGATIDELVEATQWLAHTTRAALTGLRKRGYILDRQRQDGVTRYRITETPSQAKAA